MNIRKSEILPRSNPLEAAQRGRDSQAGIQTSNRYDSSDAPSVPGLKATPRRHVHSSKQPDAPIEAIGGNFPGSSRAIQRGI